MDKESLPVREVRKFNTQYQKGIIYACGGKQLSLAIDRYGCATEYLELIPDAKSVDGETTALFRQARMYFGTVATQVKAPIHYIFSARHTKMKDWAKTKGNEIFHWDNIYQDPESSELIAVVDIPPSRK